MRPHWRLGLQGPSPRGHRPGSPWSLLASAGLSFPEMPQSESLSHTVAPGCRSPRVPRAGTGASPDGGIWGLVFRAAAQCGRKSWGIGGRQALPRVSLAAPCTLFPLTFVPWRLSPASRPKLQRCQGLGAHREHVQVKPLRLDAGAAGWGAPARSKAVPAETLVRDGERQGSWNCPGPRE